LLPAWKEAVFCSYILRDFLLFLIWMDNFCTEDELVIHGASRCCQPVRQPSDMATASGLQLPQC
jgi:hypothetical protein